MAPLIVLIIVTALARLAGQLGVRALGDWAAATRVGLAVMFCFTAREALSARRIQGACRLRVVHAGG